MNLRQRIDRLSGPLGLPAPWDGLDVTSATDGQLLEFLAQRLELTEDEVYRFSDADLEQISAGSWPRPGQRPRTRGKPGP